MAESASRKPAGRKGAAKSKFDLATAPGHLLRRAQQYAFDVYTQEVGADGLTPRQFAVLLTVEQNEGLSQTDLVQLTGIDRSTLADMISRLLKRDLLARKRTEADQRANAVRITATGRRALKSALPGVTRAENRVLRPLPVGKRAEFLRALTVIASAADEAADGAAPAAAPARKPRRTAKPKAPRKTKRAPTRRAKKPTRR